MSPKHDGSKVGRHAAVPTNAGKKQGGATASISAKGHGKANSVSAYAAPPSMTQKMPSQQRVGLHQASSVPSGGSGGSLSGMPPKKTSPAKIAGIVSGLLLALLIMVYGGVAFYFSKFFMPDTTLGPLDVSLMSVEQAESAIADLVDGYTLEVEGLGFSASYSSSQLGIKADQVEAVKAAHDLINHWLWPLELMESHDVSEALVASHDAETMKSEVAEQVAVFNETADQPIDADIAYDEESDRFKIMPDSVGTALDPDAIAVAMDEAIVSLNQAVKLDEEQLLQPSIKADDERLLKSCEQANEMIATDFDITVDGEVVLDGGPDISHQWIVIDENAQVTFDDEAMLAWSEELAEGFNTVGTTRTYIRPDGEECTVSGGTYGWAADTTGLLEQVKDALNRGESVSIEIPCSKTADHYAGPGEQDWGTRYIDIDISEQYVRLFDDGEILWESDCVTGNPNNGSDTPMGVYVINGKQSPSTLIGYDEDGEKEYESKVAYWMPFVGNMVGLHDADWQPSFGGNLYAIGYGSHGCVNLPVSKAGELYDLISSGDVVVCHW